MEQRDAEPHLGVVLLGLPPHPDPRRVVGSEVRRQACVWLLHARRCHILAAVARRRQGQSLFVDSTEDTQRDGPGESL